MTGEKELKEEERAKLQALLEELAGYKGRHTELISVYAPTGSNIAALAAQLTSEQSTAQNIKSKSTRKNVIDALEKLIRHLKLYKRIPEHGLALFCGNVSRIEGQPDIKLWAIEPPQPLGIKFYRCDQTFVLDPLREMLEAKERYGLIVVDRKEATFGLLEGKFIKTLRHITSGVPGKMRAGGQCLDPNTLVETNSVTKLNELGSREKIKCYDFEKNGVGETTILGRWKTKKNSMMVVRTKRNKIRASEDHLFFVAKGNEVREIPCNELAIGDILFSLEKNRVKKTKITSIEKLNGKFDLIDISTKAGNFIANGLVVHNSALRFERIREELTKEFFRRVSDNAKELFFELPRLKSLLVGGPGPTKEDWLKEGELVTALRKKILAVKDIGYADEHGLKLLVETSQEELAKEAVIAEKAILERFFTKLAKEPEKVAYGEAAVRKALEMGAVSELLLSTALDRALASKLAKAAKATAATVHYISIETNEGVQFKNLAGIGALLRFAI